MAHPTADLSRCGTCPATEGLKVFEVPMICGHVAQYSVCADCWPLVELLLDPDSPIYK